MMTNEVFLLDKSNNQSAGILNFHGVYGEYTVELVYDGKRFWDTGPFPFISLKKVREELETDGLFILCNGSRFDVYTSGKQADTTSAYICEIGEYTREVVGIFDPVTDITRIGTVDEQEVYHRKFISAVIKEK